MTRHWANFEPEMDDDETVEIYCTFLHKTDKALLINYDDKEIWIPLIAVEDIQGKQERNHTIEIEIKEWIAIEKEII